MFGKQIIQLSILYIDRSSILEKTGSNDIGMWSLNRTGFLVLYRRITLAISSLLGTMSVRKDL